MKQALRIQRLLDLLKTQSFSSHEELLAALKLQNIPATQATLSRDLARLGIQKIHGIYQLPQENTSIQVHAAGPNLLVLKTRPGHASSIAAQVDAQNIPGLVGTLAGDDTVFVACTDAKFQNQIHKVLLESFSKLV